MADSQRQTGDDQRLTGVGSQHPAGRNPRDAAADRQHPARDDQRDTVGDDRQVLPDRILVYGVTGSGKTTLASKIGERTAIPWYAVDELTWQPGWVPVPLEAQREQIAAICAEDRWILDTAYGQWLDLPMARVQLIVALDYSRWLSLARLTRRTVHRAVSRTPICNGNIETIRRALSRDSIIAWHFRSFARKRARIPAWSAGESGPAVIRLSSLRATRRWLAALPGAVPDTASSAGAGR